MLAHRGGVDEVDACKRWFRQLLKNETRFVIPEIVDYEIRRELIRARIHRGIDRLDALEASLEYLPLTTTAMRQAAALWADVRQRGLPTADRQALDGDVILAAQALTAGLAREQVVVATTNVGHLTRLVPAEVWRDVG